MSKTNSQRKNCKDVFNAFLIASAYYDGVFEFPVIQPTYLIPNKLIAFSKALSCTDYNQLRRYNGVILPDFSLYRDMPYVMQLWNIYRSRAIGFWLQQNGIRVIVNIRYADRRTCHFCCDGVAQHCVIAIGSHGTIKNKTDRQFFCEGLDVIMKRLEPSAIVVYGKTPDAIFGKGKRSGIQIIQFDSDCSISHRKV